MKVALVSGSSKGIGKAIAKELATNDYLVYINGRDQKSVDSTVEEVANAKGLLLDLVKQSNIKEAVANIVETEGKLDLVVANIGSGHGTKGWDVPIEEYQSAFDTNLFAAIKLCTETVELMQEKGGNIIVISSIAGCEALEGPPIPYSLAKTALLSYVTMLAKQVGNKKIRVNAISPGNVLFEGGSWEKNIEKNEKKVWDYIKREVPMQKFVTAEDIARAVMFLEESEFVTGANIVVDGGQISKLI